MSRTLEEISKSVIDGIYKKKGCYGGANGKELFMIDMEIHIQKQKEVENELEDLQMTVYDLEDEIKQLTEK